MGKSSTSQTLIVDVDEKDIVDDGTVDEEGFELALSRKNKRERKISNRISVSIDEEETKVDTENVDIAVKDKANIELKEQPKVDQNKLEEDLQLQADLNNTDTYKYD